MQLRLLQIPSAISIKVIKSVNKVLFDKELLAVVNSSRKLREIDSAALVFIDFGDNVFQFFEVFIVLDLVVGKFKLLHFNGTVVVLVQEPKHL